MFGMGPTELVIILVLVVLIFGAGKIPELGRGIGEGISNFKKGLREGSDDKLNTSDRLPSASDAKDAEKRA
ncbi:MAG: twin-arginine translocase TatA/TatE family subunit [Deltaproteobacteria bacterium]|nr:twin-arginine translocase TatA/TatE family subunit [Deltaproteobacteria bacterium]